MKKILAVLLSLVMVMGLAACGQESGSEQLTPYEVVKVANERLEQAGGVAYDLDMSMKMTDPENANDTIEMAISGDVLMQKIAENDYNLAYHMTTDMSSLAPEMGELSMDMYYTDGYMYYDMLGIKYKVAMDMKEALDTINSSNFDQIEEDVVKEQSIQADGTGQIAKLVLDGNKMTDFVKSMSEEFAAMGEEDSMSIGDISYMVYLDDDGNITNIEMEMSFAMAVDGVGSDMKIDMSMDMNVRQTDGVEVELPEDLAEYEELSLE